MIRGIIVQSIALVVSVLGIYLWALNRYPDYATNPEHLAYARTYAFVTLILAEVLRSYSSRSERDSIFKIGVFSNKTLVYATIVCLFLLGIVVYVPFLRPIFETAKLNLVDCEIILLFCLIPLCAGELYKVVKRKFNI
jgi:Ca2+-transporting ATPase